MKSLRHPHSLVRAQSSPLGAGRSPRPSWRIAALLLCLLAGSANAEPSAVCTHVLVIGEARMVAADTRSRPAARGEGVQPGDVIETGPGGHVFVRFTDGGSISIRPLSRLRVASYRFDPQVPGNNAFRLELEEGTTRVISGQGAKATHERFRLNTPIAAIGVRGTDFVVEAAQARTRVAVFSGAIVVAPLGDHCSVSGLGPCGGDSAQLLSDDMGRLLVEVDALQKKPRLLPLNGLLPAPDQFPSARRETTGNEPQFARTGTQATAPEASVSAEIVGNSAARALAATTAEPPPIPASLAWGRWANAPLPTDRLTLPAGEARAGNREVTVGDGYAVLYRDPLTSPLPTTGEIGFRLADAQATLSRGGISEAMTVEAGRLNIDFAKARFATQLDLTHSATGAVAMSATGKVQPNGMFSVLNPTQWVAGAVTGQLDGAGYFFRQGVPQGTINGLTLWSR